MINQCPCCSSILLRHVRQGSVYWFCSDCRMEVPDLESAINKPQKRQNVDRTNDIASDRSLTKLPLRKAEAFNFGSPSI